MDLDTAEQYLNKISYEMPRKVSEWLNLSPFDIIVPVTVRLLWAPTLTSTKEGGYRIYIPATGMNPKRERTLKESELAEMEFGTAHEIGHVLHMHYNPAMNERFKRERAIIEKMPKGKRTPDFERHLLVDEIVAEYVAWYFVNRVQGVEVFQSRRYDKEEEQRLAEIRKKYCSDKSPSTYDRTKEAFLSHVKNNTQDGIARRLLLGSLDDFTQIPNIDGIITDNEKYIKNHPEIYN